MNLIYYPNKKLGQNFIFNDEYLNELIESFNIKKESIIVEIGSGYGNMTKLIAEKKWCKKIISIEKERELFTFNIKNNQNKKISYILSDALKINWIDLIKKISFEKKYLIILGNIPFNISNSLILNLLLTEIPFNELIFLVQKEVGERWSAYKDKKNKGKRAAISAFINFFYDTEITLKKVDKKNFFPIPKVDGIVIKIKKKEKVNLYFKNYKNRLYFFRFLKKIFFFRKKKLIKNILNIYKDIKIDDLIIFFNNLGIKENERIQELSLDNLFKLFEFLNFKK